MNQEESNANSATYKRYKLLKDLPDLSKDDVTLELGDGQRYYYINGEHELSYTKEVVENTPEWFEEIKEQEFKRWRAENRCQYHYTSDRGNSISTFELGEKEDDYRYNTGNYFESQGESWTARDLLLAKTRVEDYAMRVNEGWKPNYEDKDEYKYYFVYSWNSDIYHVFVHYGAYYFGQVYFKSFELAQKAIEDLREDLDFIRLNS